MTRSNSARKKGRRPKTRSTSRDRRPSSPSQDPPDQHPRPTLKDPPPVQDSHPAEQDPPTKDPNLEETTDLDQLLESDRSEPTQPTETSEADKDDKTSVPDPVAPTQDLEADRPTPANQDTIPADNSASRRRQELLELKRAEEQAEAEAAARRKRKEEIEALEAAAAKEREDRERAVEVARQKENDKHVRLDLNQSFDSWYEEFRANGFQIPTYPVDNEHEKLTYEEGQAYSESARRYLGIYLNPVNATETLLVNTFKDGVPTNEPGNRYATYILGKTIYHMRQRRSGVDIQWIQAPDTPSGNHSGSTARKLKYDEISLVDSEEEDFDPTEEEYEDDSLDLDDDYETDESRPRKRHRGRSTPKSSSKKPSAKKKKLPSRTTPKKVTRKTKSGTRIGAAASLQQVLLGELYRLCALARCTPEPMGHRRMKIYTEMFKGFTVKTDPHNRVLSKIIGIFAKIRLVMTSEFAYPLDEYQALAKAVILYFREKQGNQGLDGHGAWVLPAVHLLNFHLLSRRFIPVFFLPDSREDAKTAKIQRAEYDKKVWIGGELGHRETRPQVIRQYRYLLRELGEPDKPPRDEGDPAQRSPHSSDDGDEIRPFLPI